MELGPCRPSVHEEQLIAMGLEQFTPFCTQTLADKATPIKVKKLVASMISLYMLPHWSDKQIGARINRLSCPSTESNPIKVL